MDDPGRGSPDALAALSLVEGFMRGDQTARSLWVDAFDSTETAAIAFGYLAGFLLEVVATQRSETEHETAEYIRTLLRDRT